MEWNASGGSAAHCGQPRADRRQAGRSRRPALFLLLLLFGSTALAQRPPKIPIESFAAPASLSSPVLSPSGRLIAALSSGEETSQLVLIDTDRPSGEGRSFDLGKVKVSDLHWAGNDRLLMEVIAAGKFMGTPIPISRLIVLDVTDGYSWVADKKSSGIYGGDVLFADPGGGHALIASQDDAFSAPSVKRVDLKTGKTSLVERERHGVWDWFVDDSGVVRGGVDYNERRWKLWYRSHAGEPLKVVQGKLNPKDDSTVERVYFGRDGSSASIVTNEPTGRFAAYRYDLRTGEIGEPIFEHPGVDIEEVLIDPATQQIAGVRYHDERWRTRWLDPQLNRLQQRLDRALPARDNKILQHPGKRNQLLVWSGGGDDPGSYFLLDRKTSTMKPVITPYALIDPAHLAAVKPVRYKARDGLEIRGFLTLPVGREPSRLPLILFPHGGPFANDEWTYDPWVQMLANRGYAVFQPQFRGSTGFGKDFVERGHGEWGRKMQDDLDDAVDWLAAAGQVDPKRVCIVGASYGGYAALWGAIRNPERYRCAASYAGVTDIDMQLRENRKSFSATRYFRSWRSKVTGAGSFDLKSVSPLAQAHRLSRPVLIGHGEDDEVVLAKQGRLLVERLQARKADVTPIFYPGEDHGLSGANLADFLKRLELFLARHNPPDPAPAP